MRATFSRVRSASRAGASSIWVKLYPGAFSQVVEGLDSILRMPYGCFEQTSSTTYPNVLVLDYLKTTNQAAPEAQLKAEEYINLGYQRLTTFEVAGGGFSLFDGESGINPAAIGDREGTITIDGTKHPFGPRREFVLYKGEKGWRLPESTEFLLGARPALPGLSGDPLRKGYPREVHVFIFVAVPEIPQNHRLVRVLGVNLVAYVQYKRVSLVQIGGLRDVGDLSLQLPDALIHVGQALDVPPLFVKAGAQVVAQLERRLFVRHRRSLYTAAVSSWPRAHPPAAGEPLGAAHSDRLIRESVWLSKLPQSKNTGASFPRSSWSTGCWSHRSPCWP